MERIAILVEASNAKRNAPLPGAKADVERWKGFLQLPCNGLWNAETEIIILHHPAKPELMKHLERSQNFAYVLLVFSGHGYYKGKSDYFILNEKECVCVSDLSQKYGIRSTTIMDACRTDMTPRPPIQALAGNPANLLTTLRPPVIRKNASGGVFASRAAYIDVQPSLLASEEGMQLAFASGVPEHASSNSLSRLCPALVKVDSERTGTLQALCELSRGEICSVKHSIEHPPSVMWKAAGTIAAVSLAAAMGGLGGALTGAVVYCTARFLGRIRAQMASKGIEQFYFQAELAARASTEDSLSGVKDFCTLPCMQMMLKKNRGPQGKSQPLLRGTAAHSRFLTADLPKDESEEACSRSPLSPEEHYRKLWWEYLIKSDKGHELMLACEKGAQAGEQSNGGYYTTILLQEAAKWVAEPHGKSGDKDNDKSDDMLSTQQAHKRACICVVRKGQSPQRIVWNNGNLDNIPFSLWIREQEDGDAAKTAQH